MPKLCCRTTSGAYADSNAFWIVIVLRICYVCVLGVSLLHIRSSCHAYLAVLVSGALYIYLVWQSLVHNPVARSLWRNVVSRGRLAGLPQRWTALRATAVGHSLRGTRTCWVYCCFGAFEQRCPSHALILQTAADYVITLNGNIHSCAQRVW
jgi:hypothetical protein